MIVLPDLYINEAIRIRKEYLKNIDDINSKVDILNVYKDKVDKMKQDINTIPNMDNGEQLMNEKMVQLGLLLDELKKEMTPAYVKIQQLEKDSDKLYETILQKYPNITKEEIQSQILPRLNE